MTRLLFDILSVVAACGLASYVESQEVPCAPQEPTLHLSAPGSEESSLELDLFFDEGFELEVTARLRTAFDSDRGAFGYWISVAHDPERLEILEATHEGSDSERILTNTFRRTEIATRGAGVGFVSAVAVSVESAHPSFFPPSGDFSLVRARYRVLDPPLPPASKPRESVTLLTKIEYRDGLQGSGQPVRNVVFFEGQAVAHCREPLVLALRFSESAPFARGDANYDQRLDISDAVTILRAPIYGDATIRCDDAADANDDGRIDISDAVYVFNYLFAGGSRPSAPFSEPGDDPTPDGLGCRP
jgi:hypothetical protein